jgi:hypothetical protein
MSNVVNIANKRTEKALEGDYSVGISYVTITRDFETEQLVPLTVNELRFIRWSILTHIRAARKAFYDTPAIYTDAQYRMVKTQGLAMLRNLRNAMYGNQLTGVGYE